MSDLTATTDAPSHAKRTVAEFVEKESLVELLHGIGVHCAQGCAMGHPVPLERVLDAVRAGPSGTSIQCC